MRKFEFPWLPVAVGLLMLSSVSRAEQPPCVCSQAKAANECGVPMLSKLPYVSRLFKNVGVVAADCEVCVCLSAKDGKCAPCNVVEGESACLATGCKALADSVCAADCCREGACCTVACNLAKCCAEKCCTEKCCDENLAAGSVTRKVADLTAQCAATEALLEARETSHEEAIEMIQSMAELLAENAGLTAKIEARDEHDKLFGQMLELAAENGRLKAQVELADARVKLLQESIGVVVERDRLQRRVAELEQHIHSSAARTAQRNSELPPR